MKNNKFIFKKYICLIGIICIVFLNTSCKHMQHKYNRINDTDLNMYQFNNVKDDNINNKIIQIQKLQLINIIYFPLDQYYVLPIFFEILDMHADFLRNNPLCQIIIEGHTDERGTPEYNIGLGERRAYSVKRYLQGKGVLSNQMHTVSYGKEKPISFDHTEESYSKNRRVILLY